MKKVLRHPPVYSFFGTAAILLTMFFVNGSASAQTCNAHFTSAPPTFQTGGGIVLTSAANGTNAKYSWSYGTTNYAAAESNKGTYGESVVALNPGTYYMCLTVTDTTSSGCTDTFCDSVTVTNAPPPPGCDAGFGYQAGAVTNGIDFYSSSNSPTATYSWDFGDGNTGNSANSSHTYAGTGSYYACLTVNDTANGGCTDTQCDSVYVLPPPPPPTCDAHFTAANLFGNDFMFTPVQQPAGTTYAWDFGDGNTSNKFVPDHDYAAIGVYYVCLTVTTTNVSGTCTDTWCDSVYASTPPPPPPTCDAHFTSRTVGMNGKIMFNPVQSPVGTTYRWDFGDGTIDSSNSMLPVHHYSTNGPFYACLTVTTTTSSGTCTDTWCDSVKITGPVNQLPGWPSPPTCDAHFTTSSMPSSSSVGNLMFHPVQSPAGTTYRWDFGDGTIDSSNSMIPVHQYAVSGAYTVCLTVTRNFFGTCTATWCNTVNPRMGYNGGAVQSPDIVVYPNPFSETATLHLENTSGNAAFNMYDVTGRLVMTKENLGDGDFYISRTNLVSGVYFYRVYDGDNLLSNGKLIVQ